MPRRDRDDGVALASCLALWKRMGADGCKRHGTRGRCGVSLVGSVCLLPDIAVLLGLACALGVALRKRRRGRLPREITDALRPASPPRRAPVGRDDGDIALIVFLSALLVGLLAGDRIL